MDAQSTTRSATPADEEFLFRLFAAERGCGVCAAGTGCEQLRPLLEMQYRARHFSYGKDFPAAVDMILSLANGTAVDGILWSGRRKCYRTINIAVLPEHQNRGVGTWALRQIQQAAALEGTPCRLSVLKSSPALRLYERLGYVRVSADELSYEMEWQPRGGAKGEAAVLPAKSAAAHGVEFGRDDVVKRILAFVREIGFDVHLGRGAFHQLVVGDSGGAERIARGYGEVGVSGRFAARSWTSGADDGGGAQRGVSADDGGGAGDWSAGVVVCRGAAYWDCAGDCVSRARISRAGGIAVADVSRRQADGSAVAGMAGHDDSGFAGEPFDLSEDAAVDAERCGAKRAERADGGHGGCVVRELDF